MNHIFFSWSSGTSNSSGELESNDVPAHGKIQEVSSMKFTAKHRSPAAAPRQSRPRRCGAPGYMLATHFGPFHLETGKFAGWSSDELTSHSWCHGSSKTHDDIGFYHAFMRFQHAFHMVFTWFWPRLGPKDLQWPWRFHQGWSSPRAQHVTGATGAGDSAGKWKKSGIFDDFCPSPG